MELKVFINIKLKYIIINNTFSKFLYNSSAIRLKDDYLETI